MSAAGLARRDRYRALASRIRAIPGRDFGLRPYTVAVIVRRWSGPHTGDGAATDTVTPIVEYGGNPPKVRFLSDEARALGGLPAGTVEVGPITPDHTGGGITWDTLTGGSAQAGDEVLYRLTGPEFPAGADYALAGSQSDRGIHYKLTLVPRAEVRA
ncbi:MAG: hypothetical protein H3C62_17125 [Gemmatimonadaceae bacterium]|nr:hypothetical protein [Gemmatimonadaceae bacterium]